MKVVRAGGGLAGPQLLFMGHAGRDGEGAHGDTGCILGGWQRHIWRKHIWVSAGLGAGRAHLGEGVLGGLSEGTSGCTHTSGCVCTSGCPLTPQRREVSGCTSGPRRSRCDRVPAAHI